MQVSVEKSSEIERKLTVLVPSSEIDEAVKKRLKSVAKKARISGFRPGKVPMNVIEKHYLGQVEQEVINDTINSSYVDAIGQEKIVPAGILSIDAKPYQAGEDLEYVAVVELYPEIPSPTLEGRSIQKIQVDITDEDVERTLNGIRKKAATYKEIDKPAETGNVLTIDFEGMINGKKFHGGSGQDFAFMLGEGEMLKEFEQDLQGAKKGDKKKIKLTFPQNYMVGDGNALAGKTAVFDVQVKKVEQAQLPKVDDAFAEKLGLKKGGVKKMKEEIRENLGREQQARQRAVMRDRVMEALYDANDIPTPKGLVDNEVKRLVEATKAQQGAQATPVDEAESKLLNDEATRRVRMGLIARAVIEKFDIKIDDQDVRQRVTEMAQSYEDKEAFISWSYAEPDRVANVRSELIEEKVVEELMKTAVSVQKKISFQELVKLNAGV